MNINFTISALESIMRKFATLVCVMLCIFLCSCTVDTSGYSYELTSKIWETECKGGAKIILSFDDENASLFIQNGELKSEIAGKYFVDKTTFVIFDTKVKSNYMFNYKPCGNKLYLTHNSHTITLESKKNQEQ